MQHYAVIGDPIAHSLSPLIYNTLFEHYGIDAEFSAVQIEKGGLNTLLSMELDGFACTMPHKQDVIPMLDSMSAEAKHMQSVNIVCKVNGRLRGYSTDGEGLCRALQCAGRRLRRNVLILGSGGAARSAAYALKQNGARVNVAGRSPEKMHALCRELGVYPVEPIDLLAAAYNTDILINATPQGMAGCPEFENMDFLSYLPGTATVCDMVYSPAFTKLLSAARTRNLATLSGIEMLLHQAYIAFSLWTGIEVEADLVDDLLRVRLEAAKAK